MTDCPEKRLDLSARELSYCLFKHTESEYRICTLVLPTTGQDSKEASGQGRGG
jgi:hypothetical protein